MKQSKIITKLTIFTLTAFLTMFSIAQDGFEKPWQTDIRIKNENSMNNPPAVRTPCGMAAATLGCGDIVTVDTSTGTNNMGGYACSTWDESGPEHVYALPLAPGSWAITATMTFISGGDLDIFILEGGCDSDNCIAYGDASASATVAGDQTIYIVVDGYMGASGIRDLEVTCVNSEENPDDCSGAIPITGTVSGTTVGATVDPDAPFCGVGPTSPGVWYKLVGAGSDITLDLCTDTSFDTKLTVYEGDCTTLVCVGGNDDFCGLQSGLTFTADSGTVYYVLVHGFGGAAGPFTLTVTGQTGIFIEVPTLGPLALTLLLGSLALIGVFFIRRARKVAA